MCTPYLILMHLYTHRGAVTVAGTEAYPPGGGVDIFFENVPLVSSSGFMTPLSVSHYSCSPPA